MVNHGSRDEGAQRHVVEGWLRRGLVVMQERFVVDFVVLVDARRP